MQAPQCLPLFGIPHLWGHFLTLDPTGAAVHECHVAAVAVAGLGHSSVLVGVGGQMAWVPNVETASTGQSPVFSDNLTD